jgi:hypothetical protein
MGIFCDHNYTSRTGMDSGSICTKCGKTSSKEIDINKSSGLNNGTLENKITSIRQKANKDDDKISNIYKLY